MIAKTRLAIIVPALLAAAATVLCGCTGRQVLDDRWLLGLTGNVRSVAFVREDASNGLPPAFADTEGEVGFDTLGHIAYVNGMDFITGGDSIVIAASLGGRDDEAVCRRRQDGAAVCYDGCAGTRMSGEDGQGSFALRAEFDSKGRLVRLDDEGLIGTLLGLWDWSGGSVRTFTYEGDGLFPAEETVAATFGGAETEGTVVYTYLSTDSVGNWTMREARFAGTGEAAFIERRQLDYWE